MDFFALVSSEAAETVEIFSTLAEAEAALADALRDEPEWDAVLRVEGIRLIGISWH